MRLGHLPAGRDGSADAALRSLEPADLVHTARLHIEYLNEGLFPQLGTAFVQRWHRTFVDNPHACGVVAVGSDGEILGFLLGAMDQRRYVQHTLRADRWPLLVRGAWGLATRPRLAVRFLRTRLRRYLRRLRPSPSESATPAVATAVVHAVVTTPASRGRGAGRELVRFFEAVTTEHGTRTIELVTEDRPDGAGDFYRHLGWSEGEHRRNKDGRTMITFSRTVST